LQQHHQFKKKKKKKKKKKNKKKNTKTKNKTHSSMQWVKDLAQQYLPDQLGGQQVQGPQFISVNGKQFQVLDKQGEGGFSFVYKVVDSQQRAYALKRMLLADKKAQDAAQREVDFLRQLKHRAIVELVTSQVNSREALLVFEYCAGGSVYSLIEQRLSQRRPLTEPEIWSIYHAACEAVECLHSQEPPIIHRDLKVENLLISDHGVVLCDFGSATTKVWNPNLSASERRYAEDDINNNTTMSYRSPEMADLYSGHKITEKSDVWALGVLLYRLAYFEPPWETDSSLGILNCKYRIPHQNFSENVPAVIKMLLVLDPTKRPDIYHLVEQVLRIRGKQASSTFLQRKEKYRARAASEQAGEQQQRQGQPKRNVSNPSFGGGGGGGGGGGWQ
jgi:AP2-associated kinase